ncbi:MAG: magnesium transporter CorA family protein [Kiritimatiellae bacterium]|nr:magnesium transporter CorA family protein [Kiritimatiellia bacterium]
MIRVLEFDFRQKTMREGRADTMAAAMADGRFVWVDMEDARDEEHQSVFRALNVPPEAADAVVGPSREGRFDLYDSALHIAVSEVQWSDARPRITHHDFVLGERYLLSRREGPSPAMERMRQSVPEDFARFSQSQGFLLFEIGDQLREEYRGALQSIATETSELQRTLFDRADDELFTRVAARIGGINLFRQALYGAREMIHELAHRRSRFVPETTQPHLDDLATTLQRMGADLDGERQTLHELLNLYMGMVSHRTNRLINRLTVISFVFLPLTFLCGVYGMNFDVMPELRWPWGYAFFWGLCGLTIVGILAALRRARWWG